MKGVEMTIYVAYGVPAGLFDFKSPIVYLRLQRASVDFVRHFLKVYSFVSMISDEKILRLLRSILQIDIPIGMRLHKIYRGDVLVSFQLHVPYGYETRMELPEMIDLVRNNKFDFFIIEFY